MGGTEFSADSPTYTTDNPPGGNPPYWAPAGTNSDTLSSALEYIPGTAWNDTVANGGLSASGGGASILFAKPTWQTGTGVPTGGMRDVPDLALNTSPDHDPYLFCSEDGPNNSIVATCTVGFRTGSGGDLTAVGGTSAAAPTFAAILTLIEQDLGSTGFGNINPSLYEFAASSSSPFHDITSGNNIVPCTEGTPNCPATAPFQYGFTAGTGYDQVTGLGSVNANSLATAWAASRTISSITISPSATNVMIGTSVTFAVAVTPSTGVGTVTLSTVVSGPTTVLGTVTLNTPYSPSNPNTGTATFTTSSLPVGSNSITATYQGDTSNAPSSAGTTVTVTAPFTMSANPSSLSLTAGQSQVVTITITPLNGYNQAVNFVNSPNSTTGSCSGMPAGVSCTFSAGSVPLNGSTPSTVQMTVFTAANMAATIGSQSITVTGTSGTTSIPTSIGLTVAPTIETFTITPNAATYSIAAGGIATVGITVTGTNGFILGSGSTATTQLPLSYTCTGFPAESTCTFSPMSGSSVSATTLTMSIATTAPVTQLRSPIGHGSGIFYALLLPGMFGIVFVGGARTRAARLLSLIVILGFSTLWLGSCGGSSSSSNQKNPGTPAGTYPIVVNSATGGTNPLTGTFTVNLTVSN
jgi:hypothetical protein